MSSQLADFENYSSVVCGTTGDVYEQRPNAADLGRKHVQRQVGQSFSGVMLLSDALSQTLHVLDANPERFREEQMVWQHRINE